MCQNCLATHLNTCRCNCYSFINNVLQLCAAKGLTDRLILSALRRKTSYGNSNRVIKLNAGKSNDTEIIWKPSKRVMSAIDAIGLECGSKRSRLKRLKKVRKIFGRKSVESNIENKLFDKEDEFKKLLSTTSISVKKTKKKLPNLKLKQ